MLKLLTLILFAYSITRPALGQSLGDDGIEPCRQQTSYSLINLDSVDVALYYDVDQKALDFEFVKSMCKAREKISHATFQFYPGVSTKVNKKNQLECYHADKNNKDCTDSYAAACASQLVSDFGRFVCCTADGGSACDCVKKQNPDKKDEFEQCTQLNHPTIKPDQVLLNNANTAKGIFPDFNCFPIMTFDGYLDPCARFIFAEDPVKVICAMLKKNTDDGCKKQN